MHQNLAKLSNSVIGALLTFVGGFGALLAFYRGFGLLTLFFSVGVVVTYSWWLYAWSPTSPPQFGSPQRKKYSWKFRCGTALIPAVVYACFGWLLYSGYTFFLPEYDKDPVPLARDPQFATQAFPASAPGKSGLERERFELDVWKRWLATSIQATESQNLLVLTSEPFEREYETFEADLQSAPGCIALDGVSFLVSGPSGRARPIYRQIRFTAGTKDVSARVSVRHPMAGEYLLVLVKIISEQGYKLPTNPVQFNLRLKVRS